MCENHNIEMDSNGLTENRYNVIKKMIQTIAKREGIENPKIEITTGSEEGDGYCGKKSRVILQGDNKSLDLFVKGAPTNDMFKKAFDPRPIFLLEIMFYEDVYPTFNKFQTERNIVKPFTSVIECMDTSSEEGNEILIMQNARNLGYELYDKMKQMNKEHVEFVYTKYGKYHGICHALKDQQPMKYQELVEKLPINAFALIAETLPEGMLQMVQNAKILFDPETESDKYNIYSDYVDNLLEFMQKLAHHKDPYSVIVHGDCWSNNMMFKYPTNYQKTCPRKMCLLDFQLIGESSPIVDLSYFMYASSPKEIYDNLDYYLHVYYDSLSETIRDLGSDPEILMPFEELKNQWKMFSRYGLMMSTAVLKICIQEKDEVMEISEVMEATDGKNFMAGFTKQGKHEALYHQRLRCLIEHMIENQYI